jgi:hypothetical protein
MSSSQYSSLHILTPTQVNDTKPIWLYCGQVGHCQKGMSMVINQNMSDPVHTLENYQIAAAQLPIENGTTTPPPGAPPGGPPSYGSTSTSTFTADFPPPEATTAAPPPPPPPPAAATTSDVSPASLTSSPAGVATFTGAAAVFNVKRVGVAAGVVALGAAAFL